MRLTTIHTSLPFHESDTLFLQRNRFNGTWPEEYCASNLPNFGLDCDVVKCSSAKCCPPDSTCFRSDNSTGTGA
jgi:hypothetical protein